QFNASNPVNRFDKRSAGQAETFGEGIRRSACNPDVAQPRQHQRRQIDDASLVRDAVGVIENLGAFFRESDDSDVWKLSRIVIVTHAADLHAVARGTSVAVLHNSSGAERNESLLVRMPARDQRLGLRSPRACDWA